MRKTFYTLSFWVLLSQQTALACSCNYPQGLDADYKKASLVFLGDVIWSKRHPFVDSSGRKRPNLAGDEEVLFKVKTAWKGIKAGEVIKFKTEAHTCQLRVTNDPPWVAERLGEKPVKLSKTWLVFSYGIRELNYCTRSLPINLVRDLKGDVRKLDRLATRNKN